MRPRRLFVLSFLILPVLPSACSDSSSSVGAGDSTTQEGAADAAVGDQPGQISDEAGVLLDCAQPQNGPFPHNSTVADETWTADESPHQIEFDTTITGTVVLDPCATLTIATGKTLTLAPGARLIAKGTAKKPIAINARGAGAFAGIHGTGGAAIDFSYVTIHGGGDPGARAADLAGTIELAGDATKPVQGLLSVDHVLVEGSKSNGIVLSGSAGFAVSTALTITGAAQFPIRIDARAAGSLRAGAYTGNGTDRIALAATGGDEGVHEDTTLHALGIPYRVGTASSAGTLVVGSGGTSLATLTIEAGVTLEMKKGGVVSVDATSPGDGTASATGALVAVGTAAAPIVFTSAEATPAAGDWLGIWFGQVPAPTSRIDHAEVRWAGGASTTDGVACNVSAAKKNDAAIRIFGEPTTQFVTNTVIASSSANGVDRGWTDSPGDGGTDASPPSFLPTNSFSAIGQCTETYPREADGGCPVTVPCPTP